MAKRVVIIGAVALGPKVACRLRRLDPDVEIILLDRDSFISYGGCGIPYYIGGDVNDIEDLRKTTSHALRDASFFENCKGVSVKTRVEATYIDRAVKKLTVKHLDSGKEESIAYDNLVLATGAAAVRPPFPGAELDRVFTVTDLHNAKAIKDMMAKGAVGRAAVIGGGAIGLEIAEALTDLWGIETTLIEMEDQVLPTLLGKCIAQVAGNELEKHGVKLLLGDRVQKIGQGDGFLEVQTTSETLQVDIVVLSAGVRANNILAREAGLAIGRSGGIIVDQRMRTSDPNIYAGGDCVEVRNSISGENTMMALGSLANRQGRIIATNINGGCSRFLGTVGTFCIKVFDFGLAKAGLTFRQAKEGGYDPVYAIVSQADHAHFYPNSELIYISLLADRKSRKILGIEAAGKNGDGVKARVDAVAVLLDHGLTVEEVCCLETGYAPPFASAMDVINNAGNALDNILAGKNRPIDAIDFLSEFSRGKGWVLDIRGEKEAAPFITKFGERWLNLPQDQLRSRYSEIPADELLFLLCDTGPRSYEAQVFLFSKDIVNTRNVQGGWAMVKLIEPDFLL